MRKLKKKPILLFAFTLAVLYVIIYIIPRLTGALVSSYIVEYGELKIADQATGYIVRREQVYTANTGGKANRYIEENTLVRRGTKVMEVTASSQAQSSSDYAEILVRLGKDAIDTDDFSVNTGGIISYYADGYEAGISPDTMEKGDYAYYAKLKQDAVVNLKRDNISKGEPVFKVVDRTRWYIVCFVDIDHVDRYEPGDEITVEFEDDNILADVYSVTKEKDKARIILSTVNYYDKFAQTRVSKVHLITYEQSGLLIDNDSIAEVKNRKGVYVKNKSSEFVFVPIQVLATNGVQSLVRDKTFTDESTGDIISTVEIYDEILKHPK